MAPPVVLPSPSPRDTNQEKGDSSIDSLLHEQLLNEHELLKLIVNTKKTPYERRTEGYYKKRIELADNLWETCRETHRAILRLHTEADDSRPYFTADKYGEMEEQYCTLIGYIGDQLRAITAGSTQDINTPQPTASIRAMEGDVRLPRITIPQFSGGYRSWTTFRDIFTSLVHHNRALSDVQKLHYLKSSVTGEASQLIRHLAITEVNYTSAWDILLKRYQNQRALVNAQLQILLSVPPAPTESAANIKRLLDTTNEGLEGLKALLVDTSHWDPLLVYLLTRKLHQDTVTHWETFLSRKDKPSEVPTLEELMNFLEVRFRTLDAINQTNNLPNEKASRSTSRHPAPRPKVLVANTAIECPACRQDHPLRKCQQFVAMSPQKRREFIKKQSRCFNCLGASHSADRCPNLMNCQRCGRRHNTLLHIEQAKNSIPTVSHPKAPRDAKMPTARAHHSAAPPPLQSNENETQYSYSHNPYDLSLVQTHVLAKENQTVLLATALVEIKTSRTGCQILRALLDQGSQASFITEDAAQRLNLTRRPTLAVVRGIGKTESGRARGQVQCTIQSRCHPTYERQIEAYVIPTITGHLPSHTARASSIGHLKGIQLADPTCLTPGKVDLLLGADVYAEILLDGVIKGTAGTPAAQRTWLGWILSGPVRESTTGSPSQGENQTTSFTISVQGGDDLHMLMQQFWAVEEVPKARLTTPEEDRCEELYANSVQRAQNGRYIVSLPFKETKPSLGDSRPAAVRRLLQMERRFLQQPQLAQQYKEFMREYETLGHMERVSSSERRHSPMGFYYLPHHAVFKADSTTTKVRVVFDASSKTTSGTSLNDHLLTGPALQNDLSEVLLRWRQHRIALTADIEKMYRQIGVNESHCSYQMIVWRNTSTDPIQEYRLRTVTYGLSCAPYLAIRTLRQLSQDEAIQHPQAADVTQSDFYVDDLMTGANTVAEAITLQQDIAALMRRGGFHLRKWSSNRGETLRHVDDEDKEKSQPYEIEGDATVKALGIRWNPISDTFEYRITQRSGLQSTTKRQLLSEAARLFDPLGWVAPIIVLAKIMFQQLWLAGIDWDDYLPPSLQERWNKFLSELPRIEDIRIPRWTHYDTTGGASQLHGFCDASIHAYAAVVYLRFTESSQKTHITLLAAKTKVAPIQQLSIPRLELCGAVLLMRLMKSVAQALKLPRSCWNAWTDSMNVLTWIRGHPRQWKTFVANRVSQIQEHCNPHQWRYVQSSENPADCASRGMFPGELRSHSLWWNGPDWLCKASSSWPPTLPNTVTTALEKKPITLLTSTEENVLLALLERVSQLNRLVRIVATCQRFARMARTPREQRTTNLISASELRDAMQLIILSVQQAEFPEEIKMLQHATPIPSSSRLVCLAPFVDQKGLLRVGGRLRHANLPYNERHPIILPPRSTLTRLLIDHMHKATLHGGVQLTMNLLRKKYWILNARNVIRQRLRLCNSCYRYTANPAEQIMGDLPAARVTISRPFMHTGVDFTGHITLRENTQRGRPRTRKAYIAVFVCLATKAIHLEVVSDLSSDAFLAAFRRFTSRRGLCSDLYSDCGTNFVGASKQLCSTSCMKSWGISEDLYGAVSLTGVQWHFIPPAAPHFGGLWEAGVKSTKHHLRRTMGESLLTFEEASTLTAQIEACLNSRPLYPLSTDPEDLSALTPGHFLIGDALLTPPEPNLLDTNISSLRRWHLIQRTYQHFWKRWLSEYLPRLQQRTKWSRPHSNIKPGDLVLIKDERVPPARWPLGRIIDTHPGKDGLVRVVTVRCKTGILRRPITKVCLLPTQPESDNRS